MIPAALTVLAPLAVLMWVISTHVDSVTLTKAQLRWRANYEHQLWTHGDPRGFYGRFPPYV